MSVITGIVEGGPAYIAGLREGQKIVGMSVTRDEPERLAKFKVHTGEGDQQVSFDPAANLSPLGNTNWIQTGHAIDSLKNSGAPSLRVGAVARL